MFFYSILAWKQLGAGQIVPTKIFYAPAPLHSSTAKMMQYLEPYTLVMEHLNLWP